MPDDVTKWGCVVTPYLEFFDIWEVRAALVVSGVVVLSYSSWKPRVFTACRKIFRREATVVQGSQADDWVDIADVVDCMAAEYETYRILGSEHQARLRAFQDLHESMGTGEVRVQGATMTDPKRALPLKRKLCLKLTPIIAESAIGPVYNLKDPDPDPPATKTEGAHGKGEVRWQSQGVYVDLRINRNFHFELPLHPKTYASYPVVSTANSSGLFEVVVRHILAVLRSRCAGFVCPACLAADTYPARPLLST